MNIDDKLLVEVNNLVIRAMDNSVTDEEFARLQGSLNEGGSSKLNVTGKTSILASGDEAIIFSILDMSSDNYGSTVFREIDVHGVPKAMTNY